MVQSTMLLRVVRCRVIEKDSLPGGEDPIHKLETRSPMSGSRDWVPTRTQS